MQQVKCLTRELYYQTSLEDMTERENEMRVSRCSGVAVAVLFVVLAAMH